jgi:hypothetical protein
MVKFLELVDRVLYDPEVNIEDWIKDQEWYNPTLTYSCIKRYGCEFVEIYQFMYS